MVSKPTACSADSATWSGEGQGGAEVEWGGHYLLPRAPPCPSLPGPSTPHLHSVPALIAVAHKQCQAIVHADRRAAVAWRIALDDVCAVAAELKGRWVHRHSEQANPRRPRKASFPPSHRHLTHPTQTDTRML